MSASKRTPALSVDTFCGIASMVALLLAVAASQSRAQTTQPAATTGPASLKDRPKVIVVPMQNPVLYRATLAEFDKILRGVRAQRPALVILEISVPYGDTEAAMLLAEAIAQLKGQRKVAFIHGRHGGAFGAGVILALACDDIFIAPDSEIGPARTASGPTGAQEGRPWLPTAEHLRNLKAWSRRHNLDWNLLQRWLNMKVPGQQPSGEQATHDAPPQGSTSGHSPDDAEEQPAPPVYLDASQCVASGLCNGVASSISELCEKLAVPNGWIITWPDPVAKVNEQMQRVFRRADMLLKGLRRAVTEAENSDPRNARYELRDYYDERTSGLIVQDWYDPETYRYYTLRSAVTHRNVFADGGTAWRANTDRCMAAVRKALSAARRLQGLTNRYPELEIDRPKLSELIVFLQRWLRRLKAERSRISPP